MHPRTRFALHALVLPMAFVSLAGFDWVGRLGSLERELESPDATVRAAAVRELADHPPREVQAWVLAALDDADEDVRLDAAETAGRLHLVAAAPALFGWLEDDDEVFRAAAARALGTIDHPDTQSALSRALGDARVVVRIAAIEGLLRAGSGSLDATLDAALIGALADTDATVREAAATALSTHEGDERALLALSSAANDDAPEVRAAVARGLGALGQPRASSTLSRLLRDPVADVRMAAALALGRLQAPDAAPDLAALTLVFSTAEDRDVAAAAIAALGQLPGSAAFSALADAGQRAGSGALASTARAALRVRLAEQPQQTLEDLTRALRVADSASTEWIVAMLAQGLVRGHAAASPAVLDLLNAGRIEADLGLLALGYLGGDDALRTLLIALEDAQRTSSSLRNPLAGLFAYFEVEGPDGRATEPLLEALEATVEEPAGLQDRASILRLLGATHSARSAPRLLIELQREHRPELLSLILQALAALPSGAVEPTSLAAIEAQVRSHLPDVRVHAARALGAHGDLDALIRAERALDQEPSVDRLALVRALADMAARLELGGAASSELANLLGERALDADASLADAAVDALARWGSDPALEQLLQRIEGAGSRAPILIASLGRYRQPAALERLRAEFEREPTQSFEALHAAASMLGEHGDASDADRLLANPELPWPASAAASFSLARMARRGVLNDAHVSSLCPLLARHDPVVRANAAIALAVLQARCPSMDPLTWLERPHAAVVRSAAARWLAALGEVTALSRCLRELPPPSVAEACRTPSLPSLESQVDLTALRIDGRSPARNTEVAVVLADGTVALLRTDANAHLFLDHAPEGPVLLEEPSSLPLEP